MRFFPPLLNLSMAIALMLSGVAMIAGSEEPVSVRIKPGGPGVTVLAEQPAKKAPAESSAKQIDRINVRLYAVENVLSELVSRINSMIGSPPNKPAAPPVNVEPREEIPAEVFAILKRNCVQCHASPSHGELGGGFQMFADEKLLELSAKDWVRIDYSIYSGDMPQFGEPLPSEDTEEVRAYINTFRGEIYRAMEPVAPAPVKH